MKINLTALLTASVLALAGCSGSPPQASPAPHGGKPAPQPAPQLPAPPRPAPPASVPRAAATNWRDLPQSAGSWTYAAEATGSAASFSQQGTGPLAVLRCDRSRSAIVLQRAGAASGPVPATITTSSTTRRLTATSANPPATAASAPPHFEIVFTVRDPLLDAMAFSRGRFMLEVAGTQTLVLPVWSELGRVIEDCR